MAVEISKIIQMMEKIAPPFLAEPWDNIGLMVGNANGLAQRVLVALDGVESVIDEAADKNCQMIITHHPLIFKPVKNITSDSALGRRIIKLIKNNISLYSAHTNLDIADGGTNSVLADKIGLKNVENLCPEVFENMALGKIGLLDKAISFEKFIVNVKNALGLDMVTVCGDKNRVIKRVGLCTGAGADFEYIKAAADKGCDAFITGDMGYHDAQNALDLGICIIDAGHYGTEVIVVSELIKRLELLSRENNYEIEFIESEIYANTLEFF